MKVDSISLRDYLGLTEQEYDAYLQTAPGVSFRELLDSQRKTQRFRVYQLDLEHGETRAFAFGGIDALHKAGFQQPPAAEYTLVYDGELICPVGQDERDILERILHAIIRRSPRTIAAAALPHPMCWSFMMKASADTSTAIWLVSCR